MRECNNICFDSSFLQHLAWCCENTVKGGFASLT